MKYPEYMRNNARHRGPRESDKQTTVIRDKVISVEKAGVLLQAIRTKRELLHQDIYAFYDEESYMNIKSAMNDVRGSKGGEI